MFEIGGSGVEGWLITAALAIGTGAVLRCNRNATAQTPARANAATPTINSARPFEAPGDELAGAYAIRPLLRKSCVGTGAVEAISDVSLLAGIAEPSVGNPEAGESQFASDVA
jgi:hypothetical protein